MRNNMKVFIYLSDNWNKFLLYSVDFCDFFRLKLVKNRLEILSVFFK